MKKIIYVANTDWYLYNFRMNLMLAMQRQGWDVVAVAPPGPYTKKLSESGFRVKSVSMDRKGKNVLKDLGLLRRLKAIYRGEEPDLVHHFTIKPVIYGTLAAEWAGRFPVVNAVTGRGYAFMERGILSKGVEFLYRLSLPRSHAVIFQNTQDMEFFKERGLVKREKVYLVPGSGVDTHRFSPVQRKPADPGDSGKTIFLMVARMLRDKGVREYIEAAKEVKKRYRGADFWLVGGVDEGNPSAISESDLREMAEEEVVTWWGHREDVRSFIGKADVVVLPSYMEGLPRSLLEGAAMAKPIITTDTPGCRDVVTDGENGLLVPVRDVEALAGAMGFMMENPGQRIVMGEKGREKVLGNFSDDIVIKKTLEVYERVLKSA